jgi:prepilin-type N-terminal cleavage/methylation domain-containing protein
MLSCDAATHARVRFEHTGRESARKGFTLFELLLVCAIIVVLGVAVYPSIEEMASSYRVGASADQVRASWALARAHAMDEGRSYRFSIKPNTGDFRVAPDATPYWSGSDEPQPDDDRRNPPYIKVDEISKPIVFAIEDVGPQAPPDPTAIGPTTSVGQNDGNWTTVAIFLADGSAQDDVKISLKSAGSKPTLLRLRALTGVVTIRTPTDEVKNQ